MLSSYRPRSPLFVFTKTKSLLDQLSLSWGVTALYYDKEESIDKVINDQVEKFRTFSGRVQVAVEARVTQDRLRGLSDVLAELVDGVADVLSKNRGDWADGMFYGGKYDVAFGAIKHGGKNFLQMAKVTFDIGVSKD